jgi:hypothetical protein
LPLLQEKKSRTSIQSSSEVGWFIARNDERRLFSFLLEGRSDTLHTDEHQVLDGAAGMYLSSHFFSKRWEKNQAAEFRAAE